LKKYLLIYVIIGLFCSNIAIAALGAGATSPATALGPPGVSQALLEQGLQNSAAFNAIAASANTFQAGLAMDRFDLTEFSLKQLQPEAVSGNINKFKADHVGILIAENKLTSSDISNLDSNQLTKKNLNKLSDDCKLGQLDSDEFDESVNDHFGIKKRPKAFNEEEKSSEDYTENTDTLNVQCSDKRIIDGDFSGDNSILDNWNELNELAFPIEPNTVISMPNTKSLEDYSSYTYQDNTYYYSKDNYADSDGDGLIDEFEIRNNLNPNKIDTDGDGLSDYEEIVKYHTDGTKQTYPEFINDLEYVEFLNSDVTEGTGILLLASMDNVHQLTAVK
jgi:hypothetical protein